MLHAWLDCLTGVQARWQVNKLEQWVDVKGFEGSYQVSNMGRVRSLDRYVPHINGHYQFRKGRIMTPGVVHGYQFLHLCSKYKKQRWYVHRLVATHFIPNPNNYPQINHKDENRSNNEVSNLEWCTSQYNVNYGNHNIRCAISNGTEVVALDTFHMELYKFRSAAMMARELNLDERHVWHVIKGKSSHHQGYIIMPMSDFTIDVMRGLYNKMYNKPIVALDYTTEKYIGTYHSTVEAHKSLKVDASGVSKCLRGKLKQCKGYIFQYKSFNPHWRPSKN